MSGDPVSYRPIGILRSTNVKAELTPIQPVYAEGLTGRVEIFPDYAEGLKDLEGFSHIFLLYHFHQAGPSRLLVKPFLQDRERGVFATRAPSRPNPIGLSLVKLVGREGNVLHLDGVDLLDKTPILDIRPFIARFDHVEEARSGWQEDVDEVMAQKRGRRGAPGGET